MALSTRDHVKPAPKQLHWLPVEQRISYKLCLLMHYIHTGQAPQYLSNCVSTISSLGNRYRLRSCDTVDYILPRTRTKFGERGFHYSSPAAWNTLPWSDLHDITDTNVLKKRLKTVLFDRAYWLIIVIVIVKTICNAHKVNAKHRIGGAGRVTRWPEQSLVKSSIKIKSF